MKRVEKLLICRECKQIIRIFVTASAFCCGVPMEERESPNKAFEQPPLFEALFEETK